MSHHVTIKQGFCIIIDYNTHVDLQSWAKHAAYAMLHDLVLVR